ncbi:MAG: flagellar filament capping protein FliD [Gammaproteobacteria bacterium]|nr:flagellar filament capping protein FliD [Gammaproteobacteria bacterium]
MANLSSIGLGSGIDLGNLLQQIVSASRAPTETRLAQTEARTQAKISAIGTFRSALSDLRTAVEALKESELYSKRTATSTETDLFSATAENTASIGVYDIEVVSLATAHKLKSSAAGLTSTTVIGTGTLTISVGGSSFDVEIDSDNDELKQIRDAINDDPDNTGVRATLVSDDAGAHLVLTGTETGLANAIEVTASGGDGGLNQLVYDPGVLENLTEETPAANASINIDGDAYTGSDSNTITDAIDGVTINLLKGEPGTTGQLKITQNNGAVTSAVNTFVTAYNKVIKTIGDLTRYDAAAKRGSVLTGDSLLRTTESTLRSIVTGQVSGFSITYSTLSSLGITLGTSGSLAADSTKLTAALDADPSVVEDLFSSTSGFATKLDSALDKLLDTGGAVEASTSSLETTLKDINKQRAALDLRTAALEERLRAQFTAMDSLVSKLKNTSSFLTAQLAKLPGARSAS